MNVSDLLNPLTTTSSRRSRCVSSPINYYNSHRHYTKQHHLQENITPPRLEEEDEEEQYNETNHHLMIGKPRSRFSEYEDNIIRNGVAQRLTWGQISDLLPHRKRATCFNRYRTLQGIRKSRKQSDASSSSSASPPPPVMTSSLSTSPVSSVTSHFSSGPTTPPPMNHFNHWHKTTDIMYLTKQESYSYHNNNSNRLPSPRQLYL